MQSRTKEWTLNISIAIAILMLLISTFPGARIRSTAFQRIAIGGWNIELLVFVILVTFTILSLWFFRPRPNPKQMEEGYAVFQQRERARFYANGARLCGYVGIAVLLGLGISLCFALWRGNPLDLILKLGTPPAIVLMALWLIGNKLKKHWLEQAEKTKMESSIPFCNGCGYPLINLEPNSSITCPECGMSCVREAFD